MTNDNLRKRLLSLIGIVCAKATGSQLITYCYYEFAYELWCFIFSIFEISWVMSAKMLDMVQRWRSLFSRQGRGRIWNVVLYFLHGMFGGREITRLLTRWKCGTLIYQSQNFCYNLCLSGLLFVGQSPKSFVNCVHSFPVICNSFPLQFN